MTFGSRCSAGLSPLVERSLNAMVNLVFADDEGRLVVADVAVKTFSSSGWSWFMRPIALVIDAPFSDGWAFPSSIQNV